MNTESININSSDVSFRLLKLSSIWFQFDVVKILFVLYKS